VPYPDRMLYSAYLGGGKESLSMKDWFDDVPEKDHEKVKDITAGEEVGQNGR